MWIESILVRKMCLDFLQQRLCLQAGIAVKKPHYTKHTPSHSCSQRNEGKTNNGGWGQGLVCVGPWGHFGVQTLTVLHLRSGHKGMGFTETKRANSMQRCPLGL